MTYLELVWVGGKREKGDAICFPDIEKRGKILGSKGRGTCGNKKG